MAKMLRKIGQHSVTWTVIVFALLLLIDRFYWAQISQWREDQATNMWLGYTASLVHMPVGLISSKGLPNPNGMVLLGGLLSMLPTLLSVSFFLGVAQMILLISVGWKSFGSNWQYFLLTTLPPLSSIILRSTSVEFWNQYTITLINIFFIFWAVRYLKNASLWNLPALTILILLAPSLYLAGIVNAIVMVILTLGVIAYRRPKLDDFWVVLMIILLLVLLAVFVTWLPYFQNASSEQIAGYNTSRLGPVGLFRTVWESFFGIPIYVTFQWAERSTLESAFKHADARILSSATQVLLRWVVRAYLLQAVFAFTAFTSVMFAAFFHRIWAKSLDLKMNFPVAEIVTLSTLFIGLSYALSTWLGGPAWLNGERPDQTVQFLPLFLFLIFLLPSLITIGGRLEKIVTGISNISLTVFVMVNLLGGFMIIRDHLQYSGNALTEADVPLTDKMQAMEFIADDWRKYSNSDVIPVDYDLGGGLWDWVPEFGLKLTKWYPAPMSEGRGFDYELQRRYGLTNQQEGVQLRAFGDGRYLVTYAFENPPQIEGGRITHHVFGRLRVSVVEK